NERVLAVGVLKEIEDSVLLHKPGDEVEISLAVLDTVLAGFVTARQAVFEVGKAAILEHLLDDVGNRHVLEDPAVGVARKEPEPGDDFHLVRGKASVGTALRESAYEAIEETEAAAGETNFDGHAFADDICKRNRVVRRKQVEIEGEQLG